MCFQKSNQKKVDVAMLSKWIDFKDKCIVRGSEDYLNHNRNHKDKTILHPEYIYQHSLKHDR